MNHIGQQIGNYRVIAEIGSGGFARVYRGEHIYLRERTVAIKMLHTHLRSTEERDRFLQEAYMLEKLKHDNILLIYDVGIDEGFPYLVAEYAPNGSLRDRIKRYAPNSLPIEEAIRIVSQVGQALQFAHQRNIIHRDIKPENILFNANDQALLADFGIATALTSASFQLVKITGTPSYMAPEQFQGNVSKESDQYALGCIGYELLTGCQAFTSDNVFATGFKHLHENAPSPTQLNPDIPVHIEQAILKAMAKERSNRYPDMNAFIAALQGPAVTLLPNPNKTLLDASAAFQTELSDPFYAPALASTNIQKASQELVGEKIQPFPQQEKSNGTYLAPFGQYQEPFQCSDQSFETLPSLFGDEPFADQETHSSTRNIYQGRKRGDRRRWLILSIACLVTIAGIIGALLFVAFPGAPRASSSSIAIGTQLPTSATGSQVPALAPTPKHGATPVLKRSNTPVSSRSGVPGLTATAPVSTPTLASSPVTSHSITPTPNPTATATPSPTPKPSETLTVAFTNSNGTQTNYAYSGSVTLSISGVGQASAAQWSDAFYRYTDSNGTPTTTPGHPGCWVLWINGQAAEYFGQIPAYNGTTHAYTFNMNAPGGTLNFKVCDSVYTDNTGSYTITVAQN